MSPGETLVLEYAEEQRDHVQHLARVRHARTGEEVPTADGYYRVTLERIE